MARPSAYLSSKIDDVPTARTVGVAALLGPPDAGMFIEVPPTRPLV
jgi:hypothetical protein